MILIFLSVANESVTVALSVSEKGAPIGLITMFITYFITYLLLILCLLSYGFVKIQVD